MGRLSSRMVSRVSSRLASRLVTDVPLATALVYRGSKVGNFAIGRHFMSTTTGLPQLGPGSSFVALFDDIASIANQYAFCVEQIGVYNGRGWRLGVATATGGGKIVLDIGATQKLTTRVVLGRLCIAISCDGTGRYKTSVNGAAVEDHGVVAYTPVQAGDRCGIGILAWNNAIGFNFQGSACEFVRLGRALSDAELVAASNMANAADRMTLPASLSGDADATFWWQAATHWDGVAASSVSGGSTPCTFTVAGAVTKSTVTETRYVLGEGAYQDSIRIADRATDVQRTSFARIRCTTSATRIALDMVGHASAPQGAGVFNSGTLVGQVTPLALDSTVRVGEIVLPAGTDKAIDVTEGAQQLTTTRANVSVQAIRVIGTDTITVQPRASVASRLVVYGDSISQGVIATNYVSQGWTMLVRGDYPGGVSVYGAGSLALYHEGTTAAERQALAETLVRMAVDSAGARTIWLAIGTNDYGGSAWTAAAFGVAYQDLLTRIRALDGGCTVYAQSPIVRQTETANALGDTCGAYRTAIQTAAAAVAGCTYVDGSAFLVVGDLADFAHPTTAGHAKYKAAVKTLLAY